MRDTAMRHLRCDVLHIQEECSETEDGRENALRTAIGSREEAVCLSETS